MERIMVSVQNRVSRCTRRKKIELCSHHPQLLWPLLKSLCVSVYFMRKPMGNKWLFNCTAWPQSIEDASWGGSERAKINHPPCSSRQKTRVRDRDGFDSDSEKTRCEQAPAEQCLSVSRRCWIARCWHLEDAVPGGWQRPGHEFHRDRRASQIQRQLWPASPSISYFSTIASVKLCLSKTCSTQLTVTHSANTFPPPFYLQQ